MQTALFISYVLLFYADNIKYVFISLYELTYKVLEDFLKTSHLDTVRNRNQDKNSDEGQNISKQLATSCLE